MDEAQADSLRKAVEAQNDPVQPAIDAITDCILEGVTAKTKLIEEAAIRTGASKRQVQKVLEYHTGPDPDVHHWNFTIGDRGVHIYALLMPRLDDEEDVY